MRRNKAGKEPFAFEFSTGLVVRVGSSYTESGDGFKDFICGLAPYKRLGVGVVDGNVAANCIFQCLSACESASFKPPCSQDREPALHQVDP